MLAAQCNAIEGKIPRSKSPKFPLNNDSAEK